MITWRWRFTESSHFGSLESWLDGLPLSKCEPGNGWEPERWELPAGPHTVRWRCTSRSGVLPAASALLDAVTFTPGPPPAWQAALGSEVAAAGGGGAMIWELQSSEGVSWLRNTAAIAGAGQSTAESSAVFVDVTGPAILESAVRTWWFTHLLDDFGVGAQGNGSWAEISRFVPAGRHRLRWQTDWQMPLEVRNLRLTPLPVVSLEDAMDVAHLTLLPNAQRPWTGLRHPGRPGDEDYAVNLAAPDDEVALEFEFTGPGTLHATIEWPDANPMRGHLRLQEGEQVLQENLIWEHAAGSRELLHTFGPGTHRLRLTCTPMEGIAEVQISRLTFAPWEAVSLAEAVGTPGRAFITGGAGWWAGLVKPEWANAGNSVAYATAGRDRDAWLETEVTGPAELVFWYRISAPLYSSLQVQVDDFPPHTLSSGNSYELSGTLALQITSGTHRVRWTWHRSSFSAEPGLLDGVLLDRLVITPLTPLTLTEAADAPGLTFTPRAGDWTGWRSGEAVTGGDFIEVSRADAPPARLDVPLTGPGVLRWSWKKGRPGYYMPMSARLQGRVMAEYTDWSGWKAGFMAVPPGAQTVTFEFGETNGLTGVLGQLDNFTWQPTGTALTATAAVEAAGLTNLAPVTPGDWFPLESATHSSDGTDALVAGVPGSEHRLRANATGPGTLSYVTNAHAVGAGGNLAAVRLFTDGLLSTPLALQSAGAGPLYRVLHFTAGSTAHTFEWQQEFSALYRTESDYAWLDALAFTPAVPVPLAVALDQPAWTFRTGGAVPWQGATTPAGVNGSFAYTTISDSTPADAANWLETDVTGPGILYFRQTTPGNIRVWVDGGPYLNHESIELTEGAHTIRWAIEQPTFAGTSILDDLEWLPRTWTGWQAHHFPAGTPAAVSDFTADPDHDGRPNGLEAWLGSSPLRADTAPPLSITPQRFPYLTFDTVSAPPHGITLAIEIAANPAGPWSTVCQSTAPQPWSGPCYFDQPPARARERRYFYAGSEAARFFRMKVTPQP